MTTTDTITPAGFPADLTPREYAGRGLEYLAARLEPIIARVLKPHLQGLDWPVLLEEMDRLQEKKPKVYAPNDVQSQLLVLTRRLGSIGFPFDDMQRSVSTPASALRIMRNRVAHMDEITMVDAWRTLDYASVLLSRLGDAGGCTGAEVLRDSIMRLTEPDATPAEGTPDTESTEPAGTDDVVEPDEAVFARSTSENCPRTALSNDRFAFEPWTVSIAGDIEVLDHLKRKGHAELVRSVIEEITAQEGPIHLERLAVLTGRSFGLGRVEAKRVKQIQHQVKNAAVTIVGSWVWPADLAPATWTEFRPNSSLVDRDFTHIAPEEIRNASTFLRDLYPGDSVRDHHRRVLQTFGRKRLTGKARKHLEAALGD